MNLFIISQPSADVDELFGSRFSRILAGSIEDRSLTEVRIAVAFLKRSGLGRIEGTISRFRRAGGRIRLVVGVDHHGTSAEGLQLALELADEVTIYHDESAERTFHPKVYLAYGDNRAVAWVGSGNLTGGGLYTNYELIVEIHLDLSSSEDAQVFAAVASALDTYESNPQLAHGLDRDLLARLGARQLVLPESSVGGSGRAVDAAEGGQRPEPLFGRGRFAAAPPLSRASAPARVPQAPETVPEADRSALGEVEIGCFWKVLSSFDVSSDSAPGQIIIPISFRDEFPEVGLTREADPGGHGRQWECSFSVVFEDVDATELEANDARFIIYEPRTGHARPNTEARFTFRDQRIFTRLRRDDILVFQRLNNSPHAFRIRRLAAGSHDYGNLYSGHGRRFGVC